MFAGRRCQALHHMGCRLTVNCYITGTLAHIPRPHIHYANMSMQFTAIFHGCKNGNFQIKKCEIFLIFAQNIDHGYTLEPPR